MKDARYEILGLFTLSLVAGAMLYAGVGALLPYIAESYALTHAHVGSLASAMLLGPLLTSWFAGMLCDRFGDRATVLGAGTLAAVSLIGAALAPSFAVLLCCMFVYGIAFFALIPAGSHAILFYFSREQRGLAMGIRQTGVPLGGFFGSIAFAALAERGGPRSAFFVAAAVVLAACIVSAVLYREPANLRGARVSPREMIESMRHLSKQPRMQLLCVSGFLLFFVQSAFIAFFPMTLIREAGYPKHVAAALFALASLFAVAGRIGWGRLSDRQFRGSRTLPLALVGALSAAASLAMVGIAHLPLLGAIVTAIVLGIAGEGWYGLAVMGFAEIGGEKHAAAALGFGVTVMNLAGVAAPVLMGLAALKYGLAPAWALCVLAGVAALFPALAAPNPERSVAR